MSNDKMREEFEAWYLVAMADLLGNGVRDQAQKNLAWTRDDGSYADPALRLALMAWEASRAALVVLLPKFQFMDHLDAQGYYKSQVKHAIQDLGLAVKP